MRIAVAWFVSMLVLVGCGEPSNIDPEAAVEIRGSAQHLDGSPVTGGTAMVVKDIGLDDFAASAPVFFGTMGMVCLAGADLDLCEEEGLRTELSEDGSFAFSLRGRDVQSGFGTTSTLWATVAAAPEGQLAGPSASIAFKAREATVELSPLRLWNPDVTVTDTGRRLRVEWPALPRKLGADVAYQARMEASEGSLVWGLPKSGNTVDTRVLEDISGAVSVQANVEGAGERGPATYRSAQQPFTGPGAPPSRGATCSAAATKRQTVTYDPCPLTDGVFDEDFDPALDPRCPAQRTCPHHDTAVVVDLGEIRPAALAVLRADPDVLVLSTSVDGRRWQRLATVRMKGLHAAVALPRGTRARYVRIRAERWPLPTLRELSIW